MKKYFGTVKEALNQLNDVRGEIVIVIEGNSSSNYENISIIEHVHMYIKEGYNQKEAIKLVAKDRNMTKKEIYNIYHNIEKGD